MHQERVAFAYYGAVLCRIGGGCQGKNVALWPAVAFDMGGEPVLLCRTR
jgi:hypothetical protein